MKVGLLDVDSHKYPSLPLMKISAYHKEQGDEVEMVNPLFHYDRVYVSKVFNSEYSADYEWEINADEVIEGGTGRAITVQNGKEVYDKSRDIDLPPEIEHIYPDYSLYPEYTRNTAYGFLTRGCPNDCPFCIVSKKEGRTSHKVADLSEFWHGQKNIELLDANILACRERKDLLRQLIDSKATVNFCQGLDARFITDEIAEMLAEVKIWLIHFAFDLMDNEQQIIKGLETWAKHSRTPSNHQIVYVLTNFNTTFEEDMYRVNAIRDIGFTPDIRIYRKETAPKITKYMQRWCNNRITYNSCHSFFEYVPRADGKTIQELFFKEE